MNPGILMLTFAVLGGLALFLYGMNIMTGGLRISAGERMRRMFTHGGASGFSLGSLLGITIQSSAATVMLVGLINAGLMTLTQSVPVMLGANFGTTLAMQLISFRLGDYCFIAIAIGFAINMTASRPKTRALGASLMGFGMLFLGMNIMSDAIRPYRETAALYLAMIDGATLPGMLLGVLVSTAITAIIQSSGATIAIAFSLISAGVITTLSGAYPIILGANLGTCMTALLGSMGANTEARRSAMSHLFFNIGSCVFGILAAPLFYRFMPALSNNLLQQAAHANTIKMALSAAMVLPVYRRFAALVIRATPSKSALPESSALDEKLLSKPESAIAAAIAELRRVARICAESMDFTLLLSRRWDQRASRRIVMNEESVNAVKQIMDEYLTRLTGGYLSHRQAILVQHIGRCMSNLERVGDHIDRIRELLEIRRRRPRIMADPVAGEIVRRLHIHAVPVMNLVIESMDPEQDNFQAMARKILEAHDHYMTMSLEYKDRCNKIVAAKGAGLHPQTAAWIVRIIDSFDRIVRHAKTIALEQMQPQFRIKRQKLVKRI